MKKNYDSAAAPLTSNNPNAFYARKRPHKFSSKEAAQFVYNKRSYLDECFCGPKLWVCDETPMYVQLMDLKDLTSNLDFAGLTTHAQQKEYIEQIFSKYYKKLDDLLSRSRLPKRSVIFRVNKGGGRVEFALMPGNQFESVPQNSQQKIFELLEGIGQDTTPTLLSDDLKASALSIMKQSKHIFFQYEYGMVFDRRERINARELLDSKVVEIITQKFRPGGTAKIFSLGSGNLGQEAIITIMLLSRGINVQMSGFDPKYLEDRDIAMASDYHDRAWAMQAHKSSLQAGVLGSFYNVVKKFQDNYQCGARAELRLYKETGKVLPDIPDIVMACDTVVPFFTPGRQITGKAIRKQLQALFSGSREGAVSGVVLVMALKHLSCHDVQGFLVDKWLNIKDILLYEDLQSRMTPFMEFYRQNKDKEEEQMEAKGESKKCSGGYSM